MSSSTRQEPVAEAASADPGSEPGGAAAGAGPAAEGTGERDHGTILDTGSRQVGGWVTASPPQLVEIGQHVLSFPALLHRHRDLITTSVGRELASRFTGTVLGWVWPLLIPLLFFGVYYFIFSKLLSFKFGVALPPDQEAAMGVYMFVGVLVWTAFGESVTRCTTVITENGNLIKKVAFPSEVLPLNQVLVSMVTMLFGMAMFVAATLLTPLFGLVVWEPPSVVALTWALALLPLQALFTYGLGLVLSTLQVYLRDTIHVVTVGVTVWMFATPIFWAPQIVGDPSLGGFRWIIDANPVYHLVYAWRCVLMSRQPAEIHLDGGEVRPLYDASVLESVTHFGVWAVGAFLVGYTFFLMARRRFADEV